MLKTTMQCSRKNKSKLCNFYRFQQFQNYGDICQKQFVVDSIVYLKYFSKLMLKNFKRQTEPDKRRPKTKLLKAI